MECKINHIEEIRFDMGKTRNGSVCIEGVTLAISIHIVENWPFHSGQGWLSNILGSRVCIYFPPIVIWGSVLQKVNQDRRLLLIITTGWRGQPWFPGLLDISKKSTAFTSIKKTTERSCRKVEFTRNTEFTAASSLGNLRQNLLAERISERASNLITNKRRTSSSKHYKGRSGVAGVLSKRYLSLDQIWINTRFFGRII